MEPNSRTDDLAPAAQVTEEELAAARQSLSRALRLSFAVLSVCMACVVGLFALSGAWEIKAGQAGVKLLFGEIVGDGDERIVKDGLSWTWPEPIGRIEKVALKQRTLEIRDFWMHETPEDLKTPLAQRRPPAKGLRPGFDGALLTGDRALVHVKFTCKYYTGTRKPPAGTDDGETARPDPDNRPAGAAGTGTAGRGPGKQKLREPDTQRILDYLTNVGDRRNASDVVPHTEELLRAAVASAAIRAAAAMTVERIISTGRQEFAQEVAQLAQSHLDEMRTGIDISQIEMVPSVPLAAIGAFAEVNSATQEQADRINEARTKAAEILNGAAGDAWAELAGGSARAGKTTAPQRRAIFRAYIDARNGTDPEAVEKQRERLRQVGLLRLYSEAREDGDAALASEALAEINDVLASNRLGAAAAETISQAKAYRGSIRQRVTADVNRFNKLVDEFARNPDLIMHRLWVAVKTDILSRPTNQKFYLTPNQVTVLRLSPDPADRKKAMEKLLRAAKDQDRTKWSPKTPNTPPSRRGP